MLTTSFKTLNLNSKNTGWELELLITALLEEQNWHTELVHAGEVQLNVTDSTQHIPSLECGHHHQVHKLMHKVKTLHTAEITTSCRSQQRARESYQNCAGVLPHPMSHCQQLLWSLVTHIRDMNGVLWRILFPVAVSILIFIF